ncbi:MAG: methyltransferase domain-containing protein [Desulfomonilaceae bacterium]|jgi:SAM-dependent methyltransferase
MHKNSELIFVKYVKPLIKDSLKVLEIGPDAFPSKYRQLAQDVSVASWDTLDTYKNFNLTYENVDDYNYPIQSGSYDVVLSGSVIEHVPKPWIWIHELARITKPGGLVVTIAPISWGYHGPIDCWRIYPDGMKSLYEGAGLTILLSCWESLETPGYKRYIGGISRELQTRKRQIMLTIFGMLGFPVERAYDSVVIGRKKDNT